MRSILFASVAFGILPCFAQPVIGGAGYASPVPLPAAPGQVITLFVEGVNTQLTGPVRGSGSSLPTMLAGVSVTYHQASDHPAAMIEVQPISSCAGGPPVTGTTCGTILAVTVQLPFEMLTPCPLCERAIADFATYISVSVNGVSSAVYAVQPFSDQVHFLTSCDIVAGATGMPGSTAPCAPLVTHADGSMVSAASPAKAGEQLVAYALGLGPTNPPLTDGQAPSQAVPTATTFAMDFNYRANALATKPPAPTRWYEPVTPVFTGATPGFVGLYQVNFIVPPAPANLPACAGIGTIGPYANVVQSNLTVSVGSNFSFDGAGICVAAGS
jgi:uncharacterized protein (TIGR03437 family)